MTVIDVDSLRPKTAPPGSAGAVRVLLERMAEASTGLGASCRCMVLLLSAGGGLSGLTVPCCGGIAAKRYEGTA
jgi:hypothetical protein